MASPRLPAFAAALACLLAAGYLALQSSAESKVRKANELGAQNRLADALHEAQKVSRAPAVLRALGVEATAAALLGRLDVADHAFTDALDRDPDNWRLHEDRGVILLQMGKRGLARREMSRALALNPKMKLPPGFIRQR
jgi:Flp pilus assembly protein TadD